MESVSGGGGGAAVSAAVELELRVSKGVWMLALMTRRTLAGVFIRVYVFLCVLLRRGARRRVVCVCAVGKSSSYEAVETSDFRAEKQKRKRWRAQEGKGRREGERRREVMIRED